MIQYLLLIFQGSSFLTSSFSGADQGQEGETRGKERMTRGASPARRKTRRETSHVPDPLRRGRSLVPEKSPVLDRKLVM